MNTQRRPVSGLLPLSHSPHKCSRKKHAYSLAPRRCPHAFHAPRTTILSIGSTAIPPSYTYFRARACALHRIPRPNRQKNPAKLCERLWSRPERLPDAPGRATRVYTASDMYMSMFHVISSHTATRITPHARAHSPGMRVLATAALSSPETCRESCCSNAGTGLPGCPQRPRWISPVGAAPDAAPHPMARSRHGGARGGTRHNW